MCQLVPCLYVLKKIRFQLIFPFCFLAGHQRTAIHDWTQENYLLSIPLNSSPGDFYITVYLFIQIPCEDKRIWLWFLTDLLRSLCILRARIYSLCRASASIFYRYIVSRIKRNRLSQRFQALLSLFHGCGNVEFKLLCQVTLENDWKTRESILKEFLKNAFFPESKIIRDRHCGCRPLYGRRLLWDALCRDNTK